MVLRRIFGGVSDSGFSLHSPCKSTKLNANRIRIGWCLETWEHMRVHYINSTSFMGLSEPFFLLLAPFQTVWQRWTWQRGTEASRINSLETITARSFGVPPLFGRGCTGRGVCAGRAEEGGFFSLIILYSALGCYRMKGTIYKGLILLQKHQHHVQKKYFKIYNISELSTLGTRLETFRWLAHYYCYQKS